MNITNQQKLDIAIQYIKAQKRQTEIDHAFDTFSKLMSRDNPMIMTGNTELVVLSELMLVTIMGKDIAEWLFWYVFETEYGEHCNEYFLNGVKYDLKKQSFPEFFNNILYFYESE